MKIGLPLGVPSPLQPVLGGKGDERAASGFEQLLEALSIAELAKAPPAVHRAPEIQPEIGSMPQQFQDASLVVETALDLTHASLPRARTAELEGPDRVETVVSAIRKLLTAPHTHQPHAVPRHQPVAAAEAGSQPAPRALAVKSQIASPAPATTAHCALPDAAIPAQAVPQAAAMPAPAAAMPAQIGPGPVTTDPQPASRLASNREPAKPDGVTLAPSGKPVPTPEQISARPRPPEAASRPIAQHDLRQRAVSVTQPGKVAPPKPAAAEPTEPRTVFSNTPRPAPSSLPALRAKPAAIADPGPAAAESRQAVFSAQLQAAEGGVRVILRLPRLTEAERGELAARIGQLLDGFGHRRREIVIQEIATA